MTHAYHPRALAIRPYDRGLHDLGRGAFTWLQPNGSWGWSNSGLIVDGDEALLVDTLFDLRLTQEMLDAMRREMARFLLRSPAHSVVDQRSAFHL